MASSGPYFQYVAAVNCEDTLQTNLAASQCLAGERAKLCVQRQKSSAAEAYNLGLAETLAPIIIFVHQDVYLPSGWESLLSRQLDILDGLDPNWAVAGIAGIGVDSQRHGRLWSTGLGREIGLPFTTPQPTISLDEVLLILRRDSGLRFDEDLPGFHLYGTDIVQAALAQDQGAYVIHAPVIHNSKPVRSLAGPFTEAYAFMQKKWHDRLPIRTTVTEITLRGDRLNDTDAMITGNRWRRQAKRAIGLLRTTPQALLKTPTPQRLARGLGYEDI